MIQQALQGGASWIWLRDRDLPAADRRALAEVLLPMTRQAGASLSVGGDVALAAEIGADGVHLRSAAAVADARRRLGSRALIGVSAHGLGEVGDAAQAGANYVTLSPIFTTSSKPGYGPALGLSLLRRAAQRGIPVLALGGVRPDRVDACCQAGASGVAAMGEIMRAEHPRLLVAELVGALRACAQGSRGSRQHDLEQVQNVRAPSCGETEKT
jgi:thiamine-phosphate pyrophosphorylase